MKVFGGCPSLWRNQTPTRHGLGLNSGPHASQHSGRQSCHCTFDAQFNFCILVLNDKLSWDRVVQYKDRDRMSK